MELKQNDTVVVDGKTARVQTWWGAGRHKMFKLDDGREIADLDKMIDKGIAKVVQQSAPSSDIAPKNPWRRD